MIVQCEHLWCGIGDHSVLGLAVPLLGEDVLNKKTSQVYLAGHCRMGGSRSVLSPKSRVRPPLWKPRADVAPGLSGG